MKIGCVCYPSVGGSGILATQIAIGMAERGHEVHIIASAPLSGALPTSERLFFHRARVSSDPPFLHPPYALAIAAAIVEATRAHALDLLHVHYAIPHATSAYLARQVLGSSAPRVLVTLHGTDVTRTEMTPGHRSIASFAVAASDAITVPSDFLKGQVYRSMGLLEGRAIEVIPNFVDTDRFTPAERADRARLDALFEETSDRGPILFHVSNCRPVKRLRDLIEVLERVRRHIPARLVLVGDGPDRATAEEKARELGLFENVCFLGERLDFVDYLQHADAFVLPSETEGFGLAALEAMSVGVPVFAYRVGGLPEVVTSGVGRLVEPFDIDALARAILEAISDPRVRETLGNAARTRALASFRREPAIDRYERYYRQVVGSNASMTSRQHG